MLFDSVELNEESDCIRIQQRDFELIKQFSTGLEHAKTQLILELTEARDENAQLNEQNTQLNELLMLKERMWNDKLNADLQLKHDMNEKLLDKEKEVLIERERREQSDKARKALVHVAVMNKKDLEERDSMIARLQDQIEGFKMQVKRGCDESEKTSTDDHESCRRQLQVYQDKYLEQSKAMEALELQLFDRNTASTLYELTTESTDIMRAKIDSLTKALKCMYERDIDIRQTIGEYLAESERRGKRNRAVSASLAILSIILYVVVVMM